MLVSAWLVQLAVSFKSLYWQGICQRAGQALRRVVSSPHPPLPLRKLSFCSEKACVHPGPTLEQSAVALEALQLLGFTPLLLGFSLILGRWKSNA